MKDGAVRTALGRSGKERQLRSEFFWTLAEHQAFLDAVEMHKRDFIAIHTHFPSKSKAQIYQHFMAVRRAIETKPDHPLKHLEDVLAVNRRAKWSDVDHEKFMLAVRQQVFNFNDVAKMIGTKTKAQVYSHITLYKNDKPDYGEI